MTEHFSIYPNAIMENWKLVAGYEGIYSVSDLGNIKRETKTFLYKGKFLRVWKERALHPCYGNIYGIVGLRNGGKLNLKFIHRLVAQTFIPNPENKRTVNHKNGIVSDNRIENLERMTDSENNLHAYRVLGRINPRKGTKVLSTKLQ